MIPNGAVAELHGSVLSVDGVQQGHCANCGQHIVLNDVGKWMHTLQGIYPCEPAWRPRRRTGLKLLKGGAK